MTIFSKNPVQHFPNLIYSRSTIANFFKPIFKTNLTTLTFQFVNIWPKLTNNSANILRERLSHVHLICSPASVRRRFHGFSVEWPALPRTSWTKIRSRPTRTLTRLHTEDSGPYACGSTQRDTHSHISKDSELGIFVLGLPRTRHGCAFAKQRTQKRIM